MHCTFYERINKAVLSGIVSVLTSVISGLPEVVDPLDETYTDDSEILAGDKNARWSAFKDKLGGEIVEGYVQIDPERVTVSDGTAEGYNYIVSVDLYASQLSYSYTLKLKGVEMKTFGITYGVYNYCKDAQDQAGFSDTLKTLCKAIHNYGEAVKAYTSN